MARELKETKSDDESCGPNHSVKEIKEAKPKDRHSGILFREGVERKNATETVDKSFW